MKILFAASEVAPYAKTGGLADVAGSLPSALARLGHQVSVVMPLYQRVDPAVHKLKRIAEMTVPLGTWRERCEVFQGSIAKQVTVYFIKKDIYFDRPELYGTTRGDYRDNAERFIFFSRAVLELCECVDFRPDIVHCNDWQTGLIPLYLKRLYHARPELRSAKTVYTIHNLGYQGQFWKWDLRLTGLGWDVFTPELLEYWDHLNLMKAGIAVADAVTTVSKTYSEEIRTAEYGYGLEGVLRKRASDLHGIVNGIDYDEWNPARDHRIAQPYSVQRPAGKRQCKQALLKELGLPDGDAPVVGMVTRLADQKGLDILSEALHEILALDIRLVILGTGEQKYHQLLTDAASHSHGRLRVILQYNDAMARRIYAGSDLFLMPSRYEPCGLGQMHALRYGSAPVVRRTGGLADTVRNYDQETGEGTGFVFDDYTASALAGTMRWAVGVYRDAAAWKRLVRSCMSQDFSWDTSAREYAELYRKLLRKRRT